MARNRSVIEFGTSKILCLMRYAGDSEDSLSGRSCVRYEGIVSGKWVNKRGALTALEKAVEDCEILAGQPMNKAIIGVPSCFCYQVMKRCYSSFPNSRLTQSDIDGMLEAGRPQNSEGYTLIDERPIYFDDCAGTETLDAPIGHKVRRLYMFSSYTYIRNSHLSTINEMLKKLNITAERYVVNEFAEAIHFIPESERDETAILVDVGYNYTSVSCVIGSAIAHIKGFNLGGSIVTDALERKLGVSALMAENIKRIYIFGIAPSHEGKLYAKDEFGKMHMLSQYKVDSIMNTYTEKIVEQAAQILSEMTQNRFCERNTPVYLSGAGLAVKGIEEFLATRLKRDVKRVKNKGKLMLSPIYDSAVSLLDNRIDWVYYSPMGNENKNEKFSFRKKLFK